MIITWSLHHYYIIITFTIIITVTHSYIGCYYISLQNHITILLQHYHDYIMITSLLQMGNNESIIQCHAKSKPPLLRDNNILLCHYYTWFSYYSL